MNDVEKKTVFLLNTHLNNIMNAPGYLIEYLDEIIEIFSKRPDTLLFWRPHPLSESTFLSISSKYYEAYQLRLERVSGMSNGIVDTTPDIDRAIILSDAYIGDISSSVTALYALTGKPMLLVEPLKDVWKERPLIFIAAGYYKDKIYFSASEFNGLFCKDLRTGKQEYLGRFTTEDNKAGLHRSAYVYGDECWFIPQTGNCITKVSLDSLEMCKYELPVAHAFDEDSSILKQRIMFVSMVPDNRKGLWLIPFDTDIIVKIDLQTSEMYFYDSWPIVYTKGSFVDGAMVGDELWLCPRAAHSIVKVDIKSGQMRTAEWKYPENAFSGFVFADQSLWLIPDKETDVIKWNLKNNEESIIPLPKAHEKEHFLGASVYGDDIWMYPFIAGGILRINIVSQSIEYITEGWITSEIDNNIMRIWNTSDLMLSTGAYGSVAIYEPLKKRFRQLYCTLETREYRALRNGSVHSGRDCGNKFLFTGCAVEDFMKHVFDNEEETMEYLGGKTGNNGTKIWEHVKCIIE